MPNPQICKVGMFEVFFLGGVLKLESIRNAPRKKAAPSQFLKEWFCGLCYGVKGSGFYGLGALEWGSRVEVSQQETSPS